MFEISEKNEKRITLLLCVVFFGIFLYIEFNFFQYSELRLLMFMLMVLTLYGYARLQSIMIVRRRLNSVLHNFWLYFLYSSIKPNSLSLRLL